MFVDQVTAAIATAHVRALDDVSRIVWKGLAEGLINDDQAQAFAEQIHTRREVAQAARLEVKRRNSIFPPRRPQRAPIRRVAIERRRRLAASGVMPAAMACQWTTGELAVLKIVADEAGPNGTCALTLGEIAARAGVCRKLAQTTMRRAKRHGLLAVEERRVKGRPNLPNLVRIVSREWRAWLSRKPRREGIAGKNLAPTGDDFSSRKKEQGRNVSRDGRQRPRRGRSLRHEAIE